jgi:hypothetical protein
MSLSNFLRSALAVTSALAVVAALSLAQAEEKPKFEPRVGQPGRDVIWVPTAQTMVDRMLDMAKVTPSDVVMDLGSGDGRTVITAAKRGATAVGIEFNPDMVALSRANAEKAGVAGRATFVQGDLFAQDLSKATVITMFLLPSINLKLRPKILDLRPGTRIVSNSFTMGEWKADETSDVREDCRTYCRANLWIVPAKVEGSWKLPNGNLRLEQDFQMLTGTLQTGSEQTYIDGRMLGDQISFVAGNTRYTGRVTGNAIEGLAQQTTTWRANRR